jgi:DNA-binding winged helix-turn-helix (wHTH) protein
MVLTSCLCAFAISGALWQESKKSVAGSHGKTLEFLWDCYGMNEQEKDQTDSVVIFGSYRLDVGTGQLWRGKQEVRMTPKAFTALRYFVNHPGQLVTKDDLFAAVWPQTIVTEATLASCIQELRQALRDDAKAPRYIETVHRRGFRFIEKVVSSHHDVGRRHHG